MVECEYDILDSRYVHRNSVLIDTWWNVNNLFIINYAISGTVLIDTWWNVNTEWLVTYNDHSGFNRYMVECELLNQKII